MQQPSTSSSSMLCWSFSGGLFMLKKLGLCGQRVPGLTSVVLRPYQTCGCMRMQVFLNLHGYTYVRLDGTTKPEQRQILMQRYNTNPKLFIFILSTRSGGVGMNLTGADTVIFYDSDWNPAMDAQVSMMPESSASDIWDARLYPEQHTQKISTPRMHKVHGHR